MNIRDMHSDLIELIEFEVKYKKIKEQPGYEVMHCCNKLKRAIKKDDMFSLRTNYPFTQIQAKRPSVWICSDEGYGGIERIKYCPFCGALINIRKKTSNS